MAQLGESRAPPVRDLRSPWSSMRGRDWEKKTSKGSYHLRSSKEDLDVMLSLVLGNKDITDNCAV